ncbi:S10 family peptidase [Deinococcus peraridilitoris]|uniref:Carboxypeptidase C (Cathepsin A) n=1 Tax=Deinococcus peraridilitoris (strain DSM 19664 / LMG 22246 / CIP 109416 / KR-200) TaxID=937777 RepID=L0A6K5_DEIPD|nr:carboxypeptidase C (cathepsin A) [Deinococcus peraridilitoris]AFZ68635.1 carboxypeptidase C (cathepsin A) [Deinococcus peraridilitoris DSM 19664]
MPADDQAPQETKPTPAPTDRVTETRHTVRIGDQDVAYTVKTGTLVLKEERHDPEGKHEGEKAHAEVFFIAYLKDVHDASERHPITFSFNGGPGSSSVWLHLGVLGPRRIDMGDAGELKPPPYGMVDNEFSLLDETDLVFIDPVSTGFSRAVSGEKTKDFLGFKKDIESVGDFIRLFVTREQRWLAPKFLIGESYGTTRAAGLSGYLQERHGLFLNGVMLVSSILDFQTVRDAPGNDLPPILHLPTYTATAWYHGKLEGGQSRPLAEWLHEAEAFASGPYLHALFVGDQLGQDEYSEIKRQLARLTGLSEQFVERSRLRISLGRFCKELLREQGHTVGRLDSRFTGIDRDSGGEGPEYDPSYSAIQGPYSAALNHYVRAELGYTSDLPYEILSFPTNTSWSYKEFEGRYVNVSETLRKAMTLNPALKVLVASGYYDFATPYYATEHTLSHLGLDASLQGNLVKTYYEAGHMMYVHPASLERLKRDLASFVRAAWQ